MYTAKRSNVSGIKIRPGTYKFSNFHVLFAVLSTKINKLYVEARRYGRTTFIPGSGSFPYI